MEMNVTFDLLTNLSDDERAKIRSLSQVVYPPNETAEWPGRHIEWSIPECCVRIMTDDELISYTGIVLRQALHNDRSIRIGGVGGVMTHPEYRRQGIAQLGLRRSIKFFHEELNIEFALLVCKPDLIAYYSKLGWHEFNGQLIVKQYGNETEFTFNRVMTYDIQSSGPITGIIDLCGPPW
jgi:GNAT superfamily N-acetyltransferase